MNKIRIKDFGPIKAGLSENDGFIEISPLTVFCGNQATGKSTVAKLYATFTWLEKALFRGDYSIDQVSTKKFFIELLKNQRINDYLSAKSEIMYIGKSYSFSFSHDSFFVEKNSDNDYIRPRIIYIAAERNLLSAVEESERIQNLPLMLNQLMDEYREANLYFSNSDYHLPISSIKVKYDPISRKSFVISSNKKRVYMEDSSSGIQSVAPLIMISDYEASMVGKSAVEKIKKLSSIERQRLRTKLQNEYSYNSSFADILLKEFNMILTEGYATSMLSDSKTPELMSFLHRNINSRLINIVEEPELNLYPTSQARVLYKLLDCLNSAINNELIITTHSPYLISILTLCVKANELKEKGVPEKKLSKIVPNMAYISNKDLRIFETHENGTITLLPELEGLPSDENLLNMEMGRLNQCFGRFLDYEDQIKK